MTEVDHISVPWLERKVLDALDNIEGRLDNIQDLLADVELGLRAVIKAYDQNEAIHQETRDAINRLVAANNALNEKFSTLIGILTRSPFFGADDPTTEE